LPVFLSQIKVFKVEVVIVRYEVNIFISLQANPIFLSEKEERLSIQVEVFALDRDALGNYCVACGEGQKGRL